MQFSTNDNIFFALSKPRMWLRDNVSFACLRCPSVNGLLRNTWPWKNRPWHHWCHCKYPWCFFEFRTVCLNLLILFMTTPQVKMYNLGLMQHQKGNCILTLQLLHCSSDVGNYVGTIPTLPWSRFALYNTMQFSSESLTLFLRVLRLGGFLASNIGNMSIRTIFTWFSISFLVCSYPPLLHWVLPHSFSSSFRLSKLIAAVLVAHHGQEEEIQVCDQAAIMSHKVKLKIISCPDFCEDVTTQCF